MKHKTPFPITGILLLLLSAASTHAQQARKITLNEAVELSIKNSPALKASQARIEQATASLREAKDHRLPDVKISGSYLYLPIEPNTDLRIKTNGNGNSGGAASESPKIHQAAYGTATASLPLYSGNRINYGIESAGYLQQAAKLDAGLDREELILNTINAYTNLYKAKAAIGLVKESLLQSQQRANDFANLEKNGLLARNDLLKAQLQASNIALSLLDAESNWKMANVNMNLLLGLPESTLLEPDSASLTAPADNRSIEEYEQLALQHRKDIEALSMRRKAAATGIKIAEGERLPTLALTGGYVALDVPKLVSVTNAVNIGVGLQYNLSSLWKSKAKIQQAKAKETELLANESALNDAVRLGINQAYQNYLLSKKKMEVYQKEIEQATENYKITKNKYDNSLVTTTDLLDADVAQLRARLNYAFAEADVAAAHSKLLETAGLLNDPVK